MIGRLVLAKILKYQAVACDFDFNSNIPVKYFLEIYLNGVQSCLQLVFTYATLSTCF